LVSQSDARSATIFVNEFDAGRAIIIATLLSPRAARLAEAKAFTGPILLKKFNTGPGAATGKNRKHNHQCRRHFCNVRLKCHGVARKGANF
jgi:hypothetical protein